MAGPEGYNRSMKRWRVNRLPEYEKPVKLETKKILRAWKKITGSHSPSSRRRRSKD